jgi:hypothetical protein
MLSLDITFYIAYVVLWGIGETTVGFLIVGIPSIPTVVKKVPFLGSMVSLLRSFRRTSEGEAYPVHNSWPRAMPRKRRDQWDVTDLDTYDLITTTNTMTSGLGSSRKETESAASLA